MDLFLLPIKKNLSFQNALHLLIESNVNEMQFSC